MKSQQEQPSRTKQYRRIGNTLTVTEINDATIAALSDLDPERKRGI